MKKVYEPSPHKDVCSTIGMGFLDSTLTYIDDIDCLVPPRMLVTIRICHYHCLLRGIPINSPSDTETVGCPPKDMEEMVEPPKMAMNEVAQYAFEAWLWV